MDISPQQAAWAPWILGGLIIVIILFTLYTMFNKRGRKLGPEVTFGAKVVEDMGEIADYPILLGRQKLKLFGLEKNGEKFLAIEVSTYTPLSVQINWLKIDDNTLHAINKIVRVNN